jgi:excisionase family DNA binding protein
MERATYSVPEAAKRLGVGRGTAYEAVRKGEIPSIKVGGRILVPREALEKMLESAGQGAAA